MRRKRKSLEIIMENRWKMEYFWLLDSSNGLRETIDYRRHGRHD